MPSEFDSFLIGANAAFAASVLAEPVAIERPSGAIATIARAIVDHGPEFEAANPEYQISVWFLVADLAWTPAKGDIVTWNAKRFFVGDIKPDDISASELFCRLTKIR